MDKIINVLVNDRYIRFPISTQTNTQKIKIFCENKLISDFDLRLDDKQATEYVYYDIGKYIGGEIAIAVPEEVEYSVYQCAEQPDRVYPDRPYIHFTAPFGWLNDPNGLVEYNSPVTGEKTYHMFYQHNPYDTGWGNMHWGHTVSKDLIHWEHRPIALYPDEMGTVFSGSAIVDKENRSGLKDGDEDVILLYYTAAGGTNLLSEGQPFTQCLAYSTDGGKTLKKYENNPVLPHILSGNRDPKVVWCEELSCYIMAIYLDGNEYALHRSDDLIHWTLLQRFDFPNDGECPDIYPINADGDPSKRKWVISGASYHYMICECKDGKFDIIQQSRPLNYGWYSYASQTISDVSDGRRINIAWHRNLSFKEQTWCNGQMSVPLEITLKTDDSGYTLCAQPIAEIYDIIKESSVYSPIRLSNDEQFSVQLKPSAYMIDLDLSEMTETPVTIKIFGNELSIDPEKNTIVVKDQTAPLSLSDRPTKLRTIVDRNTIELFVGDGEIIMTAPIDLNDEEACLQMIADKETIIASLTVSELSL